MQRKLFVVILLSFLMSSHILGSALSRLVRPGFRVASGASVRQFHLDHLALEHQKRTSAIVDLMKKMNGEPIEKIALAIYYHGLIATEVVDRCGAVDKSGQYKITQAVRGRLMPKVVKKLKGQDNCKGLSPYFGSKLEETIDDQCNLINPPKSRLKS